MRSTGIHENKFLSMQPVLMKNGKPLLNIFSLLSHSGVRFLLRQVLKGGLLAVILLIAIRKLVYSLLLFIVTIVHSWVQGRSEISQLPKHFPSSPLWDYCFYSRLCLLPDKVQPYLSIIKMTKFIKPFIILYW